MTFAVPLKVTFRLFVYDKDPETGDAHDARRQGGRGLLRRDPADDATTARSSSTAPSASSSRQLHRSPGVFFTKEGPRTYLAKIIPVPRLVGGVRVRPEGRAVGPHRPQAQVPRHRVPARPRPRDRRVDPAPVLRRRSALHVEGGRQVHAHHPALGARAGAPQGPPDAAAAARPTRSSPASSSPRRASAKLEAGGARTSRSTASELEHAHVHRRRGRPRRPAK